MMPRFFNTVIVSLLAFVLVTPTAFFVVPQKAKALEQGATYTQDLGIRAETFGTGEFSPQYDSVYDDYLNANPGDYAGAKAAASDSTGETAETVTGTGSGGCLAGLAGVAIASSAGIAAGLKVLGFGSGSTGNPADIPKTIGACLMSTLSLIQQSINSAAAVSSSAAQQALVLDAFVLQPLAFILSGNLLKLMTQGVISFVIGKANGTGIPQFVADIRASLQTVSDAHTIAYFNEFIRSSRSPWNTAILSQLRKEYLNETSLAGFWAANMDTLQRTSPYAFGYLNGNWAQGGVASWFALTTQFQNNPYLLYPTVKEQLASVIGPGVQGATGARVKDIENGQGFVSWCGSSDGFLGEMTTDVRAGANAAGVDQAANDAYDAAYNETLNAAIGGASDSAEQAANDAYDRVINSGGSVEEAKAAYTAARQSEAIVEAKAAGKAAYDEAFAKAKAANAGNNFLGVAPGDPCTNADGTTGTIKTPGSVIMAALNKALGGQQDNVVRMGNVGPEINNILANIGVVLKTVNFATQILGGPGSGGIFGVDQPSGAGSVSPLRQYADSPGNLGATNSSVVKNTTFAVSGPDMLARVAKYEAAVNTIRSAANTASTSVSSLISYCADQLLIASSTPGASTPIQSQLDSARTTFTRKIAPILSQTARADRVIAAARALVQKIQEGQSATTEAAAAAYAADMQTLQNLSPSPTDLANAEQSALRSSVEQTLPTASPSVFAASQQQTSATSSPADPLTFSGGTLVDQLDLIAKNATELRLTCTAPSPGT